MFSRISAIALASSLFLSIPAARGQDPRNVQEPVFPPVCTTLTAQLTSGTAPGTLSSETQLDTSRIQAAMDSCPSGQAVELAPAPGYDAFLVGPMTMRSGVTLLVDTGVTVYASRNPRDYDSSSAHTCGTVDSSGNGCKPVITADNTSGAGIMGYGTIDGRGYMPILGRADGETWWDNANDADVNGGSQNNPRLINMNKADRFTLYKIRLMNSPMFHVFIDQSSNLTAWDVKIVTPYDARNSDGIDPNYSTNVTITQSHISTGDDQVAIGGNKIPGAHYYTVKDNWFGNGHGLSIGSYTLGGVDHLLAENLTFSGLAADHNATAVHIKSDVSRGGVVQDLTYRNICTRNVYYPIWLDPFYSGPTKTGSLLPWYKNISISNLHSVTENKVIIQGYNATVPTEVSLSNVIVDGIQAGDFVNKYHITTPTYAQFTLGPEPVNFVNFLTGPGVTVTDNIVNDNPPYSCPANVFAPIMGELISGAAQIDPGTKPTIEAQILTTQAVPYQTYKANLAGNPDASLALTPPTGTVTIYDGQTALGSAPLTVNSNNGLETVSIPLNPLSAGVHTLTAAYSGDSNYPAFSFGSYNVAVGHGDTTSTALSISTVAATAGESVTFSASVTAHGNSTPAGTVQFTAGSLNLGTATLDSNGNASITTSTLTPGTYNVVASFTGQQSSPASQSSPQTLTIAKVPDTLNLSANPATATSGSAVTITATVQYAAGNTLYPTGTVTINDGSTKLATLPLTDGSASLTTTTLGVGTHNLSASYSGDGNFASGTATASVSVTP
ncbi:MAG TPA: Ig-like domain repeat protein [Acidobacteriaceae bacterium]|nr:Ig-like domain repeat protein [Acidobacteriaceae bacterium]